MYTCNEILDLISLRLDGELTPEQELMLAEHLASCPECRALADDLADIHSAMPGMNVEPPAFIMERVMERIKAEAPAPIPFPVKKEHNTRWRAWGGVAAALVLAAVGLYAVQGGLSSRDAGAPVLLEAAAPASSAVAQAAESMPESQPSTAPVLPQAQEPAETQAEAPAAQPSDEHYGKRAEQDKTDGENASEPTAGVAPRNGTGTVYSSKSLPQPSATPEPTATDTPGSTALMLPSTVLSMTPAEAAKKLYETVFAESYPDAEYIEKDDRIQYILEPMHPISADDPDGQRVSFVLDYRYLSDNGKYHVFLVESVFIDNQETGETRGSHMQFIAYPSGGEGEVLYEPSISDYSEGQYQVSKDYEAAQTAFWDKINK